MPDPITDTAGYTHFTDEELVRSFHLNGSAHAVFMEIVKRYKEKVYYHVRRILLNHDDADDAAQNTFIRVWENLGNFRGDCALFSWIYRIATNEALGILRKKKSDLRLDDAETELASLQGAGWQPPAAEMMMELQKALLTLPEKQRIVFQLKYFEDLTYDKISEITGTSVGALKASYFHAVKKIENQLSG